jgi:hypothetical protein
MPPFAILGLGTGILPGSATWSRCHTVSVVFRELNAEAIEATYALERSTIRIFAFVFLYLLGHGIFL